MEDIRPRCLDHCPSPATMPCHAKPSKRFRLKEISIMVAMAVQLTFHPEEFICFYLAPNASLGRHDKKSSV